MLWSTSPFEYTKSLRMIDGKKLPMIQSTCTYICVGLKDGVKSSRLSLETAAVASGRITITSIFSLHFIREHRCRSPSEPCLKDWLQGTGVEWTILKYYDCRCYHVSDRQRTEICFAQWRHFYRRQIPKKNQQQFYRYRFLAQMMFICTFFLFVLYFFKLLI